MKDLRKSRNETLHEAAMGTNIDMTLICKFEQGERLPTNEQIQRLAKHYDLDEKQLVIEVTAERILTKYGPDVTYGAAMYVQEEMEKHYPKGLAGGNND